MVKARSAFAYTVAVLSVLVSLQGCSNTIENTSENTNANVAETEKQTPETLAAISKELTDLVDIPAENGKLLSADDGTIDSPQSKRNAYLEQKQARLANVPAQVIKKYQQALTLMKSQQWQSAEQLFEQVLLTQPQLSGAYVNMGLIAIAQKDFNRANKQLDKALLANPINPYAYQVKGRVARLTGNFEQAEKSYLKALDIWPEYPEAQVNLAILLELYRGRLLDARKYYSSYLVLKADDQQVQRWLAGVEIKIKRAGLVLPEKANDNLSVSDHRKKSEED
jgi:tetratricopeptide (TPR) repeat protein